MEFVGLFLGVETNGYFIRLKPTIKDSPQDYVADLDGNSLIDMTDFETRVDIALP